MPHPIKPLAQSEQLVLKEIFSPGKHCWLNALRRVDVKQSKKFLGPIAHNLLSFAQRKEPQPKHLQCSLVPIPKSN